MRLFAILFGCVFSVGLPLQGWSAPQVDVLLGQLREKLARNHRLRGAQADLVDFSLSPRTPQQGDSVTIFVRPKTELVSPDEVKIFLKGSLDSQEVSLRHPAPNLWIFHGGPFDEMGSHEFKVELIVEDFNESEQVRQAIVILNQEILELQDEINHETDPDRKADLEAQLQTKIQQRAELQITLEELRKSYGEEIFSFEVGASTDPGEGFPMVESVSPPFGPQEGGTEVSIAGENFAAGAVVLFGGVPATSVTFVDENTLTAVVPAFAMAGPKDVEVQIDSTNSVLSNGFFAVEDMQNIPNQRPVAFAGVPQRVTFVSQPGPTVQLNGSLSYDDDGDTLENFRWTLLTVPTGSALVPGSSIPNDPSDTTRASFVADKAGLYFISLVVNDGQVDSVPSSTIVEVAPQDPAELEARPDRVDAMVRVDRTLGGSFDVCNNSTTETVTVTNFFEVGDSEDELEVTLPAAIPFGIPAESCRTVGYNFVPIPGSALQSRFLSLVFLASNSGLIDLRVPFQVEIESEFPFILEQSFFNLTAPILVPNNGTGILPAVLGREDYPISPFDFEKRASSHDFLVRNISTETLDFGFGRILQLLPITGPNFFLGATSSFFGNLAPGDAFEVRAFGEVDFNSPPDPFLGDPLEAVLRVSQGGFGQLPIEGMVFVNQVQPDRLQGAQLSFDAINNSASISLRDAFFDAIPTWPLEALSVEIRGPEKNAFSLSLPGGFEIPQSGTIRGFLFGPTEVPLITPPVSIPDADFQATINYAPVGSVSDSAVMVVTMRGTEELIVPLCGIAIGTCTNQPEARPGTLDTSGPFPISDPTPIGERAFMQIRMAGNPDFDLRIQSIDLVETGTYVAGADITTVSAFVDVDSDGIFDPEDQFVYGFDFSADNTGSTVDAPLDVLAGTGVTLSFTVNSLTPGGTLGFKIPSTGIRVSEPSGVDIFPVPLGAELSVSRSVIP